MGSHGWALGKVPMACHHRPACQYRPHVAPKQAPFAARVQRSYASPRQDRPCCQRRRLRWIPVSAETWNPQNVPGPQVTPSQDFSAVDTVKAQLDALQNNNEPWPNHGLLTMYEFGETIGGLDRCYYFGHGKDLYHFDHFMGQFQNAYPELVNLQSYSIEGSKYEEDVHKVLVKVTSSVNKPDAQFVFILAEKDIGTKKGSLMTRCLIRHQPK